MLKYTIASKTFGMGLNCNSESGFILGFTILFMAVLMILGSPGDPKVIAVTGDFNLNGDGVGILVVTGQLTFNGNVNYDGVILVIGEGFMLRNGAGNGTLSGEIVVANTAGPDGLLGNSDDAFGPPTFDTSGGGNGNVNYCSTFINN